MKCIIIYCSIVLYDEAEYERNILQQENVALSQKNEALEGEITGFEEAKKELEELKEQLAKISESLEEAKSENALLKDDVSTQRDIIGSLQHKNTELSLKLDEVTQISAKYEKRARLYEEDKLEAGGVLERSKAQAEKIISEAKIEASSILYTSKVQAQEKADEIMKESEKSLADNVRKIKYLQKRRGELLSAFEKIKDAAGGFYDNVANMLSKDMEE